MAYNIIEEIGSGGMGSVYKATDSHGHTVALKMMSNKVACYSGYRKLFNSEVTTLRSMDHPNVVHIVGDPYQDNAGNLILPMEYVPGTTLDKVVQERGPMPPIYARQLMDQILDAMQYVHDRGRIHRDIKPSNIMLRPDGTVCIIDFGIAKDAKLGSGGTVGTIIGTNGYWSPEQATGHNIDCRTDIYSLGCVLYYLLTGQNAINTGNNQSETIISIVNTPVTPPSQLDASIPVYLNSVIMKALDKDMRRRYQSASAFRLALAQDGPIVTVGSQLDNDIIVKSEYVSRHHLVIKGVEEIDENGKPVMMLEISDDSTNGTGVEGRPLRRASMRIPFNGTSTLPCVLMAAREECPLDWNTVISMLRQKGWGSRFAHIDPMTESLEQQEQQEQPEPQETQEGIGCPLGGVCFLFPIVGIILWLSWKGNAPRKSKQAGIIALISFILSCISSIMVIALAIMAN